LTVRRSNGPAAWQSLSSKQKKIVRKHMNATTNIDSPNIQTIQPPNCPTPLAPAQLADCAAIPNAGAVPTAPMTIPVVPATRIAPAPISAADVAGVGTLDVLSEAQAARLRACEAGIQKASMGFVEIGLALATIKEEELYREGFDSFETYCQVRWGFQLSKVYNWITAAKLFTGLANLPDIPKPDHEAQLRPLFGLAPSQAELAWQCAAAMSAGRQITQSIVKSAVKQLQLVAHEPPRGRINKSEQRRVVTEAIAELLVLARQKAANEVLIEKLERLDHHIRLLLAPSQSKALTPV
jgi:hypothetical protein